MLESVISPAPFVRVKVQGKEIYAKGLIDTGNSCKNSLISEEFFNLCGGEFLHSNQIRLNTAAKGEGLPVIGQSKSFKICLEGISHPLLIKPLVVRGLTHPLNLGISLLQINHCVLESSPTTTLLRLGKQAAPMISHEEPVLSAKSSDKRFPTSLTGYAQLGTLVMLKQVSRSRDHAR